MEPISPDLEVLRKNFNQSTTNKAAWAIIEEYFRFFHAADVHEELWMLKTSTLFQQQLPSNATETDRENMIFFLEFSMLVMEAIHRIYADRLQPRVKASKKRKK